MSDPEEFSSALSPDSSATFDAGFSSWTEPGAACTLCTGAQKPQESRKPCDVDRLILTDYQTGAIVKASAKLVGTLLGKDVPPHIVNDLKEFDVVLERVVDYKGRRIDGTSRSAENPKVKLDLQVATQHVGACLHGDHPLIQLSPRSVNYAEPKADRSWKALRSDRMQMEGWPSADAGVSKGVSLFAPLWTFGRDPQSWRVTVSGCAIRETGTPLGGLSGLVRIYSHDEYEFSFSFPAAIGYSASKSRAVNVKGDNESKSSSSSSLFGKVVESSDKSTTFNWDGSRSSSASGTTRSGDILQTESRTGKWGAEGKLESYSFSSTRQDESSNMLLLTRNSRSSRGKLDDGQYTGTGTLSAKGELKNPEFSYGEGEFRPQVSLKKNGQELDFTKFLNNLFFLEFKIKKAIEDIKNLVPAVGWNGRWFFVCLTVMTRLCRSTSSQRKPQPSCSRRPVRTRRAQRSFAAFRESESSGWWSIAFMNGLNCIGSR